MPLTGKELLKVAKKEGWKVNRATGSHHQMTHPNFKGVYTIAVHNKELSKHLEKRILKIIKGVK